MYATLTFPAACDLAAPRRTPAIQVRSSDDLRTALRHARGHSLNLDATQMDRILHLDAKKGLIELQAATRWNELAGYLAAHKIPLEGFALMPSTAGEAVSQAAPGLDGLPVSARVAAITLCTPDGELRRADRNTHAEAGANLRWATREWAGVEVRFGIKTTLGASVAAAEVRRALLGLALAHGGSFPIRGLRDATREQLEACYPMIWAFLADKRRSDPAERLHNSWYRRLMATMRSEVGVVRWGKTA